MLIEKTEVIDWVYQELVKRKYDEKLKILSYKSNDYPGYSYIKIYNKNAKKENMLDYLKTSLNIEKVISFGTIPDKYTFLIEPGDSNAVVKTMKKEYEPLKGRKDLCRIMKN